MPKWECRKSGFQPAVTNERGFDHGTFVPLKLAFPEANIPVLQLSLLASMDAKVHTRSSKLPCFTAPCDDLSVPLSHATATDVVVIAV